MIKVVVIGTGKVGMNFIHTCKKHATISLVQIYQHQPNPAVLSKINIPVTRNISNLVPADLYIVCVADSVIPHLDLRYLTGLVVHTSGATSFLQLQATKRGVLYPLQSFSNAKLVDLQTTPLCVETEHVTDLPLLLQTARCLSNLVYEMNENQRSYLHVAAVFINNFSNHVIGIGKDICESHHIDFELFSGILANTFDKIKTSSPDTVQTGPAIRNDVPTIQKHLGLLPPHLQKIYQLLTNSIQEKHGTKL